MPAKIPFSAQGGQEKEPSCETFCDTYPTSLRTRRPPVTDRDGDTESAVTQLEGERAGPGLQEAPAEHRPASQDAGSGLLRVHSSGAQTGEHTSPSTLENTELRCRPISATLNKETRTSLVIQRYAAPARGGHELDPWSGEDPTCQRATEAECTTKWGKSLSAVSDSL